jgi:hypothetical protein
MKDILFYFLFLITLKPLVICTSITELDYYAYYSPKKSIIVCSNKPYQRGESNLILNEFETDDGYTCLLNLKKEGLYRVSLHLSKINENEKLLPNDKEFDIKIGDSIIYSNVLSSNTFNFIKQILIKLENGKVFYILNNNCDINNLSQCKFTLADNSLFLQKLVKINFTIKENYVNGIALIEKSSKAQFKATDDCDPPCVYGLCSDSDCLCQIGYMGINCSISKI